MVPDVDTLLLYPRSFFDRRADDLDGFRGAMLGLGLAVAVTSVIGSALRFLAVQLTGTTTVDNPDRPPAKFCDESTFEEMTVSGCDEPATQTVQLGEEFWDAALELLPWLLVGLLVVGFLLAVGLYLGAVFADGDGTFGATLEVTAWGVVPSLLTTVVGAGLLAFFASQQDLSASDPGQVVTQFQQLRNGVSGLALGFVRFVGTGWQAYVWASGLAVVHDLSSRAAWAVAGAVAFLPFLLSL